MRGPTAVSSGTEQMPKVNAMLPRDLAAKASDQAKKRAHEGVLCRVQTR